MIIAIIGASGSGKGHICDYLEYRYPNKFQQIDVTAIIRKYITKNDAVGRKLFAYRKAKKYIPDDFIYEIVKTEVINALDSGKIVVLNNYPRTVELAKKFEIVHRIDFVLFLKNTYETMKKRLDNRRICSVCGTVTNVLYDTKAKYGICRKCGGMLEARIDDEVEYVEKKWDEFVINGVKLYNYFSPRLVELNGEKTEDIVLREALNALDIFFKKVKELHGKV